MTQKNKIRITHDGSLSTLKGTKIVDAETGESLTWVERIEVVLDPREGPRAFIYTIAPELDITVEAEITPYERQVAERVADAVMQRLHAEFARIEAETDMRLQARFDEYAANLKALNPRLVNP